MQHDRRTLWGALNATKDLLTRFLWDSDVCVALDDLTHGTCLYGPLDELQGRSVLVATTGQLTALLSLVELDGVARRIVLCPPDLATDHYGHVAATAGVDTLVFDQLLSPAGLPNIEYRFQVGHSITPGPPARRECGRTEWVLLTSGTTGLPKMVVHTLATLAGAISGSRQIAKAPIWSTFYDIRRYGGLQIALRALLAGGSLVLSNAKETVADFLVRAGAHGVTHISGTPSHWRRALLSPFAGAIAPHYVRLSGEIADQALLDRLRAYYPEAGIAHAFAATEAGVAFEVNDGLAGFPANLVNRPDTGVDMRIADGSLRIRSKRTAVRYLDDQNEALTDKEGFVDTGDLVELYGARYHFTGRRGGVINVGGLKVHPEEVEAAINRHPSVRMCLVTGRKSSVMGSLVAATVVPASGSETVYETGAAGVLQAEILAECRKVLAPHKVPAVIRFVPSLEIAASGKVARPHA